MPRETYVCVTNPKTGKVELVEKSAYVRPMRQGAGMQVIRDIEPYQNVVNRGVVGGRRQHREFLRRHDLVELGDQAQTTMTPRNERDKVDMGIINELKRVMGKL